MGKRKIIQRLERDYGEVPGGSYFAGDMENITSYYDYRRDNNLDDFLLDETTWYDLEMDEIFKRINPGLTTSGEQYLYYMLRHPALTKEDYNERCALISEMTEDSSYRLKLQFILSKLGRNRKINLSSAFNAQRRGPGRLILYIGLALIFVLSVFAAIIAHETIPIAILVFLINTILHTMHMNQIKRDFETVNYSVLMISTLRRIRKLRNPGMDALFSKAYESLNRFRFSIFIGGVMDFTSNEFVSIVSTVFLQDLISYEILKRKFSKNHQDFFTIHEHLGKLDASIAIASYKKSIQWRCAPEIDFSDDKPAYFNAVQMVHPMMKRPVANDLAASAPILITGSNASGKSTYIKTTALCAILAQTIGVCTARSYRASAFRIYSAMAVTDNLAAGESYYIVEIKSLKRIFDAADAGGKILCVIDEVLRGTNTVERIAASTEVLSALWDKDVLCLAATHDIELCSLLAGKYDLYHFEETIGDDEMTFDYKVKTGPAGTRNAINLLNLMGFDDAIVQRAHARANTYMETGLWSDTPAQQNL